jgi:hypothetical protein
LSLKLKRANNVLLNFDDDTETTPETIEIEIVTSVAVSSEISIKPYQSYQMKSDWSWQDLRDYVVSSIEAVHGPFPRNAIKESGIFKGFLNRWGDQSQVIAKRAFEVYGGMWAGAPISVYRFAKSSDEFFAKPILNGS